MASKRMPPIARTGIDIQARRRGRGKVRLMLIKDSSLRTSGFACISLVCFMTKMPIFAMFWRTSRAVIIVFHRRAHEDRPELSG